MGIAEKLLAIIAAACLQGCTLSRTIIHNFADLDDHRIFANRIVAGGTSAPLRALGEVPETVSVLQRARDANDGSCCVDLEHYLDHTQTVAFVALLDGRIVYERYTDGVDAGTLLNSFSIAKAIMATLVGIAQAEGRITSLDTRIVDLRPDFAGTAWADISLRQLLTMTSGVPDPPTLLPSQALYYYGHDLRAALRDAPAPVHRPDWRYSEADLQMLGFALEAAVGTTLSDYLSEKLWRPMGMEAEALWSLDHEGGIEKTFCCLSARARDFARFGQLYLNGGRWNGRQLLPDAWAQRNALPGVTMADGYVHRHLWWTPPGGNGDFYAYGHQGQYLYVNPRARVVIVKFSRTRHQDPVPMFRALSQVLSAPQNVAAIERTKLDVPAAIVARLP